jgi:hypothetical protein
MNRSSARRDWPPWGLILIALVHALGSSIALIVLMTLREPPGDPNCVFDCNGPGVDPWQTGSAPYLVALYSVLLISSVATFLGKRAGRWGLLTALCVLVAWGVIYETYAYVRYIVAIERPGELASLSFWRSVAGYPIPWLAWIAFNAWYLFGQRTARHFSRNHA